MPCIGLPRHILCLLSYTLFFTDLFTHCNVVGMTKVFMTDQKWKKSHPRAIRQGRISHRVRRPAFRDAAHFQIKNPSWVLVHAVILGPDNIPRYHAWCEKNGMVWDLTEGAEALVPASQYYRAVRPLAQMIQRFNAAQARFYMDTKKTYGPWATGE